MKVGARNRQSRVMIPAALVAVTGLSTLGAQGAAASDDYESLFSPMSYRSIGPSRGGRAQAVSGVVGDRDTYYMGATGGGVWKTTNGGQSWNNVSDGYFKTGAVGAIAVSESDPSVLYVGMGEYCIRGNFSHGDGVYKSEDAGETWTHVGLEDTLQIGRIRVHPDNPDVAYVAALGHIWGPNEERGVYRTTDGGENWEKVHYVNETTGAVDIAMNPDNPDELFAAFWQVQRSPWSLDSGGEGGGLYKSTDGGDTWEELTNGLPEGVKGKIGISISPVDTDLVWAIVEAEDGGVFRSDNGGESWRRTNSDNSLRQRAWYYTHIIADTKDVNMVYVLNVGFHRSRDGGRTFDERISVPHGDNHDLWIDPHDNTRMIEANDGGACVSYDQGASWSAEDNQPTAQFYHVITDSQFPYRVYGAQQDNSTVSISSAGGFGRRRGGGASFYSVGGGESGYIAPRHDDPNVVYAGSYGGLLTRYDHRMGKSRNITVYPENPMGAGVEEMKHRFQWTFPIVNSVHDPDVLYATGNVVFKSTDEGQSWKAISHDLTTDDKSKQKTSGGPITQDNTSVEYYATIFTLAESPLDAGVLWSGSDDGLIHVTRDGGETWRDVTPSGMGENPLISLIDASPHDAGTAYAAVNRYKSDDFNPMIYKTDNYGRSWQKITRGIADDAFVRAVREDPVREGLLFAGTETGMWMSMNDGASWQSMQLDLPVTPITDLVVHGDDVVVATQGRSFWILDDISPVRQMNDAVLAADLHVFEPSAAVRGFGQPQIYYYLGDAPESEVSVEILEADGDLVNTFTSGGRRGGVSAEEGLNAFAWDMRYEDAVDVPGAVYWGGSTRGPTAAPGEYTFRITAGGETAEQTFNISGDPRVDTTRAQYEEQFALLIAIRDKVSDTNQAVIDLRSARGQIDDVVKKSSDLPGGESIASMARDIKEKLQAVEDELIQWRSKSSQDPLNFPIRLNNKLTALAGSISLDFPVTAQAKDVFADLSKRVDAQLAKLAGVMERDIPAFNQLVRDENVPAVKIGG